MATSSSTPTQRAKGAAWADRIHDKIILYFPQYVALTLTGEWNDDSSDSTQPAEIKLKKCKSVPELIKHLVKETGQKTTVDRDFCALYAKDVHDKEPKRFLDPLSQSSLLLPKDVTTAAKWGRWLLQGLDLPTKVWDETHSRRETRRHTEGTAPQATAPQAVPRGSSRSSSRGRSKSRPPATGSRQPARKQDDKAGGSSPSEHPPPSLPKGTADDIAGKESIGGANLDAAAAAAPGGLSHAPSSSPKAAEHSPARQQDPDLPLTASQGKVTMPPSHQQPLRQLKNPALELPQDLTNDTTALYDTSFTHDEVTHTDDTPQDDTPQDNALAAGAAAAAAAGFNSSRRTSQHISINCAPPAAVAEQADAQGGSTAHQRTTASSANELRGCASTAKEQHSHNKNSNTQGHHRDSAAPGAVAGLVVNTSHARLPGSNGSPTVSIPAPQPVSTIPAASLKGAPAAAGQPYKQHEQLGDPAAGIDAGAEGDRSERDSKLPAGAGGDTDRRPALPGAAAEAAGPGAASEAGAASEPPVNNASPAAAGVTEPSPMQRLLELVQGKHLFRLLQGYDFVGDICMLPVKPPAAAFAGPQHSEQQQKHDEYQPLQHSYIVLNPLGGQQCRLRSSTFTGTVPNSEEFLSVMGMIYQGLGHLVQQGKQQGDRLPAGMFYRAVKLEGQGGQGLVLSVVKVQLWVDASGRLQEQVQGDADMVMKLFLPEWDKKAAKWEDPPLQELAYSMMNFSDFAARAVSVGIAWVSFEGKILPLPAMSMAKADGTLMSRILQLRQSIDSNPGAVLLELMVAAWGVGRGLMGLHERGLVHRDVKPGNVGIFSGFYKLLDYGLARLLPHLYNYLAHHSGYRGTGPSAPPEIALLKYLNMLQDGEAVLQAEQERLLVLRDKGITEPSAHTFTKVQPKTKDGNTEWMEYFLDFYLYGMSTAERLQVVQHSLVCVRKGRVFLTDVSQQYLEKADSHSYVLMLMQMFDLVVYPFYTVRHLYPEPEEMELRIWQIITVTGPEILLSKWFFYETDKSRAFEKLMAYAPQFREPLRAVALAGLRPPWERASIRDIMQMEMFAPFGSMLAGALYDCTDSQFDLYSFLLRDWAVLFPGQARLLCWQPLAARELSLLTKVSGDSAWAVQLNNCIDLASNVVKAADFAVAAGLHISAAVQGALNAT